MYLSSRQIDLLGRVMATLAEPHEEREIRSRVGFLMLDLLGAQYYASYVWDATRECFDGGVHLNMDPSNLLQYERYYQYHDPITRTLQQHRQAVRVTDVMEQSQLLRTEFYNDFLGRDGLYWGVNLYAWSADRNIGDMRIWRDRRRLNFDREDLQLLDLVRPALVAALRRCHGDEASLERGNTACDLPRDLSLSERELEVANLAACGLHDKEIARRLGISITTVRTHLDHAFRKLGVNNRMKLVQRLKL
jgi:DNA-binding CsgD family transcriptional regulator